MKCFILRIKRERIQPVESIVQVFNADEKFSVCKQFLENSLYVMMVMQAADALNLATDT
jgi:hypothetical protein